jgi:hypothetical protein
VRLGSISWASCVPHEVKYCAKINLCKLKLYGLNVKRKENIKNELCLKKE